MPLFCSDVNVPVVPVIAPLLTNAFTVAVPAVLKLAPYNAPVNVPVVPLTAPLLARAFTVAVPAVLKLAPYSADVKVPVVPLTAPLLTNAFTVAVLALCIIPLLVTLEPTMLLLAMTKLSWLDRATDKLPPILTLP